MSAADISHRTDSTPRDSLRKAEGFDAAQPGRRTHGTRSRYLVTMWGFPLLMLLLALGLCRVANLDLAVSRCFYSTELQDWPAEYQRPWILLREYGQFPGVALGLVGLGMILGGLRVARWRGAVEPGLVLA